MTARVLLADDQALLRATFRLLIDSAPDMEVVGEASNGQEAIDLARSEPADVVLMDIRMPDLDGIEATRLISQTESLQSLKVIILTTFETEEHIIDALRAGASGFLGKDVQPADLLEAIRTVVAGEALLSANATRAVIERVLSHPAANPAANVSALESLTARELEILSLVGLGMSNDEIAQRLVISPTTAKTHVNRTMMKLHARDRAQLVVIAYESRLIIPGRGNGA